MGLYMFKSAPGQIRVIAPSVVGVICLFAAVIGGKLFADSSWAHSLTFSAH